jgi:hypothetical protein
MASPSGGMASALQIPPLRVSQGEPFFAEVKAARNKPRCAANALLSPQRARSELWSARRAIKQLARVGKGRGAYMADRDFNSPREIESSRNRPAEHLQRPP